MLERYRTGVHMPRPARKISQMQCFDSPPQYIEQLFDAIGRGVVFMNGEGTVTFMNRTAETILQVDKVSVLGRKTYMLPLRTPVYKVLSESCRDAPTEISLMGRVYSVVSSEVRNRQGAVLGEMTEIWDITAIKKEKREWEEFVAMVTHDLKSPLTVITGYLQMMKMGVYGELGDRLDAVVDQMEQSGTRLVAMVEDLLGTYQMELGLVNLCREVCDLRMILEGCHGDNVNEAREKGVELSCMVDKGVPPVQMDARQMARVFNNLIGNAIKFTPRGGLVSVSAEVAAGNLLVNIDDTGIGIPDQDRSRIFKKYYRSAGASGIKGTGLGLAISRAIVEAHGGDITVESIQGKGSRFTVVIPMGEPEQEGNKFTVPG